MRVAALETRKAKDRDLTDESLREGWRARAEELGLTRERIADRLGHERPGSSVLTTRQVERSVTANVSHFDRRDAIRAVADNLPHGAPAHEVERLADEFLASASVMRIAETPRGPRFTTERIWQLERKALAAAEQMAAETGRAVADPIAVSRVLATRSTIKADQRAMVERLTRGGRGPRPRGRRGGHRQDLRHRRRGGGLGRLRGLRAGRGADLAGGERPAHGGAAKRSASPASSPSSTARPRPGAIRCGAARCC